MYDCGPTSKQTADKQTRGHGRSCHARDLPIRFSVNARALIWSYSHMLNKMNDLMV